VIDGVHHEKDSDCIDAGAVDPETLECKVCGVGGGDPCRRCGQVRFHGEGCPDSDETVLADGRRGGGLPLAEPCPGCQWILDGKHGDGCPSAARPIATVAEALVAGAAIVAADGPGVRIGATEYRQLAFVTGHDDYVTYHFGLHVDDECRLVSARGDAGSVTWENAIAELRARHVEVVAEMRREVAAKALEAVDAKGVR